MSRSLSCMAWCVVLCSIPWAGVAGAEEVVCDPENPSCVVEEGAEEETSAEVVCDPENPSCLPDEIEEPDKGATIEVDPSAFGLETAPLDAAFRLEWGLSGALDTSWDGREDVSEVGAGADLGVSIDPSSTLSVSVTGVFRYWSGFPLDEERQVRADALVRLGESSLKWRRGKTSIRVGHLTTPWGSTDLVRPGDVLNARDQRVFGLTGPSTRDALRPQPTLEVSYSPLAWLTLDLVAIPFFVPDAVVLFGRDIALAGQGSPLSTTFPVGQLLGSLLDASSFEEAQPLVYTPSPPEERLRNGTLGARVKATLSNTDIGLGYAYGWDRTPYIDIDESAAELLSILAADETFLEDFDLAGLVSRHPEVLTLSQQLSDRRDQGEEIVTQEIVRRHTLVLDVARYVGPIGMRADVAMSPAQTFTTVEGSSLRRPTVFGALGLGYERAAEGAMVGMIVEGFWLEVFPADARLTRAFVQESRRGGEEDVAIIVGDRLFGVASALFVSLPDLATEIELGGVYTLSSRDLVARGQVRREVSTRLDVVVGAMIFEGPPPSERVTLGGLYDGNDMAFLGIEGVY